MVRVFRDSAGDYMVQTNCLTVEAFIGELADALAAIPKEAEAN